MSSYSRAFAVKRRCHGCNHSLPTTGGRLCPVRRVWLCKDCRPKKNGAGG